MFTDAVMIAVAFAIAYAVRRQIADADPNNVKLASFGAYVGLLIVQVVTIVIVAFSSQLYHLVRAVSRVDELYAVFGAVSIGTMMSVAVSTLLFKSLEFDFPPQRGGLRSLSGGAVCFAAETMSDLRTLRQSPTNS